MTSALTLISRSGRIVLAAALALAALTAACGELPSAPPANQAPPSSGDTPPQAALDPAPTDASAYFAIEEALGAECDEKWISEPPLQDAACYGMLPEHVASFIRAIPDGHPYLSAEQREEAAGTKQVFRAVRGYGVRPDFTVGIENFGSFWIRSFEGPGPDSTVFMVYGPDCILNWNAPRDVECVAGAPATVREFRLYRVQNGHPPVDVTAGIAPPPPTLSVDEQHRYGIYLRPADEGPALDTDIGLDISRLARVPVMRWVLRPVQEGEHETPGMPASDPRAFLDFDWREHAAHFGFMVWTGERFELRKLVPPDLWPCRSVQAARHLCGFGYESGLDRYLNSGGDQAAAERPI
ncbi:hypothetical protein ACW5EG_01090 [Luteimonas sp. A611]